MSKSVTSESLEFNSSHKKGGKMGGGDEGGENGEEILEVPRAESLPISTTASTVPATDDQFMFTDDFKRLPICLVIGGYVDDAEIDDEGMEARGGRVH